MNDQDKLKIIHKSDNYLLRLVMGLILLNASRLFGINFSFEGIDPWWLIAIRTLLVSVGILIAFIQYSHIIDRSYLAFTTYWAIGIPMGNLWFRLPIVRREHSIEGFDRILVKYTPKYYDGPEVYQVGIEIEDQFIELSSFWLSEKNAHALANKITSFLSQSEVDK